MSDVITNGADKDMGAAAAAAAEEPILRIVDLHKSFGETVVLRGIDVRHPPRRGRGSCLGPSDRASPL